MALHPRARNCILARGLAPRHAPFSGGIVVDDRAPGLEAADVAQPVEQPLRHLAGRRQLALRLEFLDCAFHAGGIGGSRIVIQFVQPVVNLAQQARIADHHLLVRRRQGLGNRDLELVKADLGDVGEGAVRIAPKIGFEHLRISCCP